MWAGGKGADDVVTAFLRSDVDIQQVDKNGGTGKLTTFQASTILSFCNNHTSVLNFAFGFLSVT